jgi:crotonobetainyl-CoA:carnitine CoA-transferase CaiB-like acyl-CoA transferase
LIREKTTSEWQTLLLTKGVPCGAVKGWSEFFDDEQVKAMGMNQLINHPVIGPAYVTGVPINFDKTPGKIQRGAPILGEHTREVLREIGYDDEKIADLIEAGVIGAPLDA